MRQYKNPKQIIKIAGLSLIENSSREKKLQTSTIKKWCKDLRRLLYQVILGIIRTNIAFKERYIYYTTRRKNQLTGKHAIIALCRKLLRIIHTVIVKEIDYD
ncbi:IS110 family transposase [Soehngenia saccharolytica]|nr:IS110 family transposase [Soehngenia saccharolytica]